MDWIWYYADYPSKHHETVTTYHSLTGNEWIDFTYSCVNAIITTYFDYLEH